MRPCWLGSEVDDIWSIYATRMASDATSHCCTTVLLTLRLSIPVVVEAFGLEQSVKFG